jgi:rod shape-determining protein MreC
MQNLINFLYRFRTFGFFLLLEGFCGWLVVSYNQRQNAAFLNSSNSLFAGFKNFSNGMSNYMALEDMNESLLEENEFLRRQLALANRDKKTPDSVIIQNYDFIATKVINSTFQRSMNYFTLNAGRMEGVEPGMGVITNEGVVGRIKSVSKHFSTATSLLHRNLMISTALKRTNTLCSVQWDGKSADEAEIKYIPRHVDLLEGDSIVTSGYNAVFPSGMLIGTITKIDLTNAEAFYKCRLKLAADFTSLNYAYVVKSVLKHERDSLELEIMAP